MIFLYDTFQARSVYTDLQRNVRAYKKQRANGKTNSNSVCYDGHVPHHMPRENCCSKLINCIKGSAEYRDLKLRTSLEGINSVSDIDRLARLLFPVAFTVFHIFYWFSYLNAEDHHEDITKA